MRYLRRVVPLLIVALLILVAWFYWKHRPQLFDQSYSAPVNSNPEANAGSPHFDRSDTRIHAHNLLLRKGPDFRVYVTWLDGVLARTRADRNPSLDAPNSFDLKIQTGVIRVNIGDL